MLSILSDILHGILDIPYLIVSLLVEAINGWIMMIALALQAIVALLPGFPAFPEIASSIKGTVAWFLPISAMLTIFASFLTAWLVWMGVSVALRWFKAL